MARKACHFMSMSFSGKDEGGQLRKDVYFISVYRSDQDVVETLCVHDRVVAQMKTDYPNLKGL